MFFSFLRSVFALLRPFCHHSLNLRSPERVDWMSVVSPGFSGVDANVARISRAVTVPIPWIPIIWIICLL